MLRFLMLVTGLGLVAAAAKFPPFISKCARDNPEFSKCALASARAAKDKLVRGDRDFRLQSLDPMLVSRLRVEQGGTVGLNITLNDIRITGMSGLEFTDNFNLDLAKMFLSYEAAIPRLELICEYEMQGKILILPITGKGPANFTLLGITMRVTMPYTLETREKGKQYVVFQEAKVVMQQKKAHIKLENLFNGDPLLGPQTNLFINENWREIVDDVGPSMAQGISAAIQQNLQTLVGKIPYDELVPATLAR